MAQQRVKGQNVTITLYQGGAALASFPIKDASFTLKLSTSKEGYLGETADRRDQVFDGIEGELTLHYEDESIFLLADAIIQKAQNLAVGPDFSVKAQLNMPNGATPSIQANDCSFGDIPFEFSGRTEFASVKLTFESSSVSLLSK